MRTIWLMTTGLTMAALTMAACQPAGQTSGEAASAGSSTRTTVDPLSGPDCRTDRMNPLCPGYGGQRLQSPPRNGIENGVDYTNGTNGYTFYGRFNDGSDSN